MEAKQQAVRAGGLAVSAIRHLLAVALVALCLMLAGCATMVGVAWARAIYEAASQNQIQSALLTRVSLPLIAFAAILALPLTLAIGIPMEGVAVLAFAVLYVALFRTVATRRPYVALLGAACGLIGVLIDTQQRCTGDYRWHTSRQSRYGHTLASQSPLLSPPCPYQGPSSASFSIRQTNTTSG